MPASPPPSLFRASGTASPGQRLTPLASRMSTRASSEQSPERCLHGDSLLLNEGNLELVHVEALKAAKEEHDRIRRAAQDAFNLHELREQARKEEERIQAELALAAEQRRLQALKATEVPKPPPPPPPPPTPPQPAPAAAAPAAPQTNRSPKAQPQEPPAAISRIQAKTTPAPASSTTTVNGGGATINTQVAGSLINSNPKPPTAAIAPIPGPTPLVAPTQVQQPQAQSVAREAPDPHQNVHAALKLLRMGIMDQVETAKKQRSPWGAKVGDLRRTLRKCIGQFTTEQERNKKIIIEVDDLLKQALSGAVPSEPVDVSLYVLEPREPVPGGSQNGSLPSLFVYLVNVLSKCIVKQLVTECGARPEQAEPLGIATATIFAQPDFQWRGKSLIDILIAKFRITCPVLFGIRGNEKTVEGRKRLGWAKEDGTWVSESTHNNRMTGLGAGYAAIALRKFGAKGNRVNPYPPFNYWKSMANIVNTPAAEISATQCIVLKSMIEGHEERFLMFFGDAALAALRLALVEFPSRAPNLTQAKTLSVLADVLRKDKGLCLP